ncbi:MAG: cyclophilin-like family protein [Candidatus Helarchaeota archaeon]
MSGRFKIRIPERDLEVMAEFTDESPNTAKKIKEILPIHGKVSRWGEEIYFKIPNLPENLPLEANARADVKIGEIGFWDGMSGCFCVFFGKTPASSGEDPVAASDVNIFACVVEGDPKKLSGARDGDDIIIE